MDLAEFVKEAKTNPELRDAAIREIVNRDDWMKLFDGLSIAIVNHVASEIIGLKNMSLEQLTYVAKRMFNEWVGPTRPYKARPRNFDTVNAYVIYWIVREYDMEFPLYVGQTEDLRARWRAHQLGSTGIQPLGDAESLRIKVVETVCGTRGEALEAETRHIIAARRINSDLMNGTYK